MYDSYLFLVSSWILTIGNIAYDVETIVNDIRLPMTNKTMPMTMTVNIRLYL